MKSVHFFYVIFIMITMHTRGGFRISGKEVHIYKGWGGGGEVCFANIISFFLNIP